MAKEQVHMFDSFGNIGSGLETPMCENSKIAPVSKHHISKIIYTIWLQFTGFIDKFLIYHVLKNEGLGLTVSGPTDPQFDPLF